VKYKCVALLMFCLAIAVTSSAQTSDEKAIAEVSGTGTPGFIPQFINKNKLANSNMFQAGKDIGVNTTSPQATMDVESTDTFSVLGNTSSTGLYATGVLGRTASTSGNGVAGDATATSGTNNGVFGRSASPNGIGVSGAATATTGGMGVYGQTAASSGYAAGVSGSAIADSGTTYGVVGQTYSDQGIGVLGNRPNSAASGFGGGGVRGLTSAGNNVFTYGTAGVATADTGSSVGVLGQTYSPNGTAGLFANVAGGNILLGGIGQPETTVFRVDGTGRVYADGGFQASGADFAESIAVTGDRRKYVAGDLLVIDPSANRRLALAQQPYSTLVAGIYSTKPGMLASNHKLSEILANDEVPLGVVGIVPCKVSAENGPIHVGDLLVSSSTPGHAMKGTDRTRMLGAVVGKALEPLPRGTGVIQVLVTLQ
jgi:hypothetical protein